MQIPERSGLVTHPTCGWPNLQDMDSEGGGSPKENHGGLSRTRENEVGPKQPQPATVTMVSGPTPPWSMVPLSLHCLVCGYFSVRNSSESRTQSPMCAINCKKWVPGLSHPLLDTALASHTKGLVCYSVTTLRGWPLSLQATNSPRTSVPCTATWPPPVLVQQSFFKQRCMALCVILLNLSWIVSAPSLQSIETI